MRRTNKYPNNKSSNNNNNKRRAAIINNTNNIQNNTTNNIHFLHTTRVGIILLPILLISLSYAGDYSQLMFLCGFVLTNAINRHNETISGSREISLVINWTSCLLTCLCVLGHFYSAIRYSLWNFLWAQNLILVLVLYGTWQALQSTWLWQESPRTARLMERILFNVSPFPCAVVGIWTILHQIQLTPTTTTTTTSNIPPHSSVMVILVSLVLVTVLFLVFTTPVYRSDLILDASSGISSPNIKLTSPVAAAATAATATAATATASTPIQIKLRKTERILSTDVEILHHILFLFGLPPILHVALNRHVLYVYFEYHVLILICLVLYPLFLFRIGIGLQQDMFYDLLLLPGFLMNKSASSSLKHISSLLEYVWVSCVTVLILTTTTESLPSLIKIMASVIVTNWLYITIINRETYHNNNHDHHQTSPLLLSKQPHPKKQSLLFSHNTEDESIQSKSQLLYKRLHTLIAIISFSILGQIGSTYWCFLSLPFLIVVMWTLLIHGKFDYHNICISLDNPIYRLRVLTGIMGYVLFWIVMPLLTATTTTTAGIGLYYDSILHTCVVFGFTCLLFPYHPKLFTMVRFMYVMWFGTVVFQYQIPNHDQRWVILIGFVLAGLFCYWLVLTRPPTTTISASNNNVDFSICCVIITYSLVPALIHFVVGIEQQYQYYWMLMTSSNQLLTSWAFMSIGFIIDGIKKIAHNSNNKRYFIIMMLDEFEYHTLTSMLIGFGIYLMQMMMMITSTNSAHYIFLIWCLSFIVHIIYYGSQRVIVRRNEVDVNSLLCMFGGTLFYNWNLLGDFTMSTTIVPSILVMILIKMQSNLVLGNRIVMPLVMFASLLFTTTGVIVDNNFWLACGGTLLVIYIGNGITIKSWAVRSLLLLGGFICCGISSLSMKQLIFSLWMATISILVAKNRSIQTFRDHGFTKEAQHEMILARWSLVFICVEFQLLTTTTTTATHVQHHHGLLHWWNLVEIIIIPLLPIIAWYMYKKHEVDYQQTHHALLSLFIACVSSSSIGIGSMIQLEHFLHQQQFNTTDNFTILVIWCLLCYWCIIQNIRDRIKKWRFTTYNVAVPIYIGAILIDHSIYYQLKILGWYGLMIWLINRQWYMVNDDNKFDRVGAGDLVV
jgi:hypothetical protein